MPKQTYKITAFHGGINSNSDPRDINEYESVSLVDANIDKVGKITTLGSTSDASSTGSAATIEISPNRGLYVMKSDRQLDGVSAEDTLLFNFNADDGNINARDSDDSSAWHEDVIEFSSNAKPVYYSSDGNLRVGDSSFNNDGRFFGYISDEKFAGGGAHSGSIGWYQTSQYIDKPSSGKVLISTPAAGSDTNGENSSSSEYIGSYVDASSNIQVMDLSSVNLRVGIQYNTALETNAGNWNTKTNCSAAVDTTNYISLFEDTNVLVTGTTASSNTVSDTDGATFTVNNSQAFVFGLWFTTTEYDKLSHVEVVLSNATNNITYKFLADSMVGAQKWNIFSCSQLNITTQTAAFDDVFTIWSVKVEQKSGHSGDHSADYYFSGPVIAPIETVSGFPAGLYTFHHSYLYDDSRQESLLKQFGDGDGTYGIKEVNILGSPILFNFDVYTNPFSQRQILTDHGIDISDDTIDKTSHGLSNGDVVRFEGIKNAGAISNGTTYYVVNKTANTFKLSASKDGTAINFTGSYDDSYTTGTAQSGNSTSITLASGASSSDDLFNTYVIYLSSGTGSGQYRVISDYTGSSKVATVTPNWQTSPSGDSVYHISPAYRYYTMNKRITGSRIYYKIETNDNYFLIGEVDFVNAGFKWFPEADSLSYSMTRPASDVAPVLSNTALLRSISPTASNNIDTYKTINGFSGNTDYINARYKTAVVHGRRAYIGNIKRPDLKTYPDRIIKSQVNKFDVFPSGLGSVDVAIRDGESIVKLEVYADRILQFKEHSLYIINVSETVDFLEDTLRNKGCAFDYHVTKTDFGIAWFNIHGVYFYDGQKVTNLLERGGMMVVNESDWETFIINSGDTDMSEAHIGFIPKKRQLIINNQATHIFIYDFVLGSWMKGSTKLAVTTNRTNFALDSDQDLFYLTGTASTIRKWSPNAATSSGFETITKDIDFGEPGVRKKIYRVYVTYKTGGTTNVQVKFDTNGTTTFDKVFQNGTNFTSNVLDNAGSGEWVQATLKPNTSSEANSIYSFALKFSASGTGAEVTRVKCVADSSSLDGKYFDIYGAGGKTEVWIDVGGGTSAPSGSGSYAQTIEVTEVETNDSANSVAIAVAAAIDDHANFSCEVEGDTVIITDAASASRTDASDGDTGFTITVDKQGGTSSVPATFEINDITIVYRLKSIR